MLAANFEALDEISRLAKFTPITAFADNHPIPDDFDSDPEELAETMGEWTDWFDSAEGLMATRALADHIKTNPKAAKQLDDPAAVLAEMNEMARVLASAAAQGVRFRLEMS